MDAILWFVIIVLGAAIAINIVGADIHQFIYKNSRIKKCTGNARDNVRIVHTTTGIKYKPIEIEPLNDSETKFKLIATALHPPFEHKTFEITREQLKADLIASMFNGRLEIRYIPEILLGAPSAPEHQMYTPKEEQVIVQSTDQKITELEGKVSAETANKRQDIEDNVRHASELARSGKAPTTQRR